MKITQHIPGFVQTDDPPETAEYASAAELLAVPFVHRWTTVKPGFHQFSSSRRNQMTRPYLMAEFDEGRVWYVVGFMDGDLPDLPEWVAVKDESLA